MGVNVVIILTLLPALALLPKARAGCSNSARPDPCGGPPARAVPTATIVQVVPNPRAVRAVQIGQSFNPSMRSETQNNGKKRLPVDFYPLIHLLFHGFQQFLE